MEEYLSTTPPNYLNELNEVQRAAVQTIEGPVMIIAGPGSGKTRVLTYRIAHLIRLGEAPYNILALTFTNKAAREMKARITQIVGEDAARNLYMGTFHAIFARLLRYEAKHLGYPSNFTIYDTDDAKSLLRAIIKEQNLNSERYKVNRVLNRISNAKNALLSPHAYASHAGILQADIQAKLGKLGQLYKLYTERCQKAGAMDFDDLLVKTYELLAKHPAVRKKYQQRFKYLLIDEFQDTNTAQYAIVQLLANSQNNICVVGDDAQSIYAFRGATIENILNFKRDHPTTKVFKLEQNYRSTKKIVAIANDIIAANSGQIAKQIWTANDDGSKVKLFATASDSEEANVIADSIFEERLRNHHDNEDFAILYRTNSQARALEEALRRKNIPYRVFGGVSFYQRKEIKDMLAYLRLTVNHNDEEALRRIINYPKRGIGSTTMKKVAAWANEYNASMWTILCQIKKFQLAKRTKEVITAFVNTIKLFTNMQYKKDAYELAKYIGKTSKLVGLLHKDKSVEGISRYENLQELFNAIKEFVDNKQELAPIEALEETENAVPLSDLAAYLQDISLLTDMDNDKDDQNKVKLMTVHSAKGLEFKCVYITGLEEGLFPSQRATKREKDIEEERRLFYVAATRAEQKLFLSYATYRYKFGDLQQSEPSRFLREVAGSHVQVVGGKPRTASANTSKSYSSFNRSANVRGNLENAKKLRQQRQQIIQPVAAISDFKPSLPSSIQVGATVAHQRFGYGKVTKVEGRGDKRIANITFEHQGEKRIILRFAKLMVVK